MSSDSIRLRAVKADEAAAALVSGVQRAAPKRKRRVRPLNIAMVCDFFYPQTGGVELHIYRVAQQLIDRGHSVVVITHAYGRRSGVRTVSNGLKIYYVPFMVIYRETTFPSVFSFFPIFRNIMIREQIDVVHGHATMSSLCHEAIVHGRSLGLATVFTDHSLFGFADASSICSNKLLKFTLTDVDHVICVSHTCRENTVLRGALDPAMTSVIPNAVVSSDFIPDFSRSRTDRITIVTCSRLFANKGADLLAAAIPQICADNELVDFLIAGSGPKEVDLQQMREQHRLQERVKLIGDVRHDQVRDVMVQGRIYLHSALTEAFGTAIVEAASCGLLVVSTTVGGIPEVLPEHMTVFAEPSAVSLAAAVHRAIDMLDKHKVDTSTFHDEIRSMYCWQDVARRTERVYYSIIEGTAAHVKYRSDSLLERFQRHYQCGPISGKLFLLCVVVDLLILKFLSWVQPEHTIDRARKWPAKSLAIAQSRPKLERETSRSVSEGIDGVSLHSDTSRASTCCGSTPQIERGRGGFGKPPDALEQVTHCRTIY